MATSKQIVQRVLNAYRLSGSGSPLNLSLNKFGYRQIRNLTENEKPFRPELPNALANACKDDEKLLELSYKELVDSQAELMKRVEVLEEYYNQRRKPDPFVNVLGLVFSGVYVVLGYYAYSTNRSRKKKRAGGSV